MGQLGEKLQKAKKSLAFDSVSRYTVKEQVIFSLV